MKVVQKIVCFFIIILVFTFSINTNQSFATTILTEIQGFKAQATNEKSVTGLKDVVKKILIALRVASALLLIIVLASAGIRYITESSVNVKGEIKRTMLPVVLGLVCLFGASYFAALIIDAFEN